MKNLLRCAMLVFATVAQAEELQFDLTGTAYTADGTGSMGPIDISFMLDSASGTASFNYPAPAYRSPACVQNSGIASAAFANIDVRMGGQSIWSASSSTGGYGISNINENCPVDRFVTSMAFGNSSPAVAWEFTPTQDTQASYLATGDSAQVYLGSQGFQTHGLLYTGVDQTRQEFAVNFSGITVTSVNAAEPSTLALMVLGLGGLLLARLLQANRHERGVAASIRKLSASVTKMRQIE